MDKQRTDEHSAEGDEESREPAVESEELSDLDITDESGTAVKGGTPKLPPRSDP